MFWLNVPYDQKDAARERGARWCWVKKKWYVPEGALLTPFEKWLPKVRWLPNPIPTPKEKKGKENKKLKKKNRFKNKQNQQKNKYENYFKLI